MSSYAHDVPAGVPDMGNAMPGGGLQHYDYGPLLAIMTALAQHFQQRPFGAQAETGQLPPTTQQWDLSHLANGYSLPFNRQLNPDFLAALAQIQHGTHNIPSQQQFVLPQPHHSFY